MLLGKKLDHLGGYFTFLFSFSKSWLQKVYTVITENHGLSLQIYSLRLNWKLRFTDTSHNYLLNSCF